MFHTHSSIDFGGPSGFYPIAGCSFDGIFDRHRADHFKLGLLKCPAHKALTSVLHGLSCLPGSQY